MFLNLFLEEGHKRMEARLLTAHEVAAYLGLHFQTVYTMAGSGELPSIKIGRSRKFDKLALDQWIESKKEQGDD